MESRISPALLGSGHRRGWESSGHSCGWETIRPPSVPPSPPASGSWRSRHRTAGCLFLLLLSPRLPHFTLPRLSDQWGSRLPLTAQALECPDTSLCIGDAPGSVLRGRRPSLQPGQDTIPQLPLIESSKVWGEHQRLKSTRNFPAAHPA